MARLLSQQQIKIIAVAMAELDIKHNSPLNNSTSKQQFSFSKINRFRQKLKTEGADTIYEAPSTREKVAFSFSKASRYQNQFVPLRHSPPPGSYQVEGDFQKILKKGKGSKLHMDDRQQCKSNTIFVRSDVPGPGSYHPNPQAIESKTIRNMTLGKSHTTKRLIPADPLPGPGAYQVNSLILNEHKVLSNQQKKAYGKLFFPQTRVERVKTEVLPPMRFPDITSKGEKMIRADKGFTLNKSSRFRLKTFTDEPGPGSYNKFSQFINSIKK